MEEIEATGLRESKRVTWEGLVEGKGAGSVCGMMQLYFNPPQNIF